MSDVSKTNALRAAIAYLKPIAESATVGGYGEALNAVMGAAEREIAARVPVQGEPNDDREVLARLLAAQDGEEWDDRLVGTAEYWRNRYLRRAGAILDRMPKLSRATVPDAATELAAIKARADEVGEDEGWHIGGAWGDYGEVVVPLRILSYVVDGALDEKIVSTDPGYAATYAEQVSRAEQAEAERDAATEAERDARTEVARLNAALTKAEQVCAELVGRARHHDIARTEAESERDAALAAVERCRALVAEWKHEGPSGPFPDRISIDVGVEVIEPLLAALDGAPEPDREAQLERVAARLREIVYLCGDDLGCQCEEAQDASADLARELSIIAAERPTLTADEVWAIAKAEHDYANDSDNVGAFVDSLTDALRTAGVAFDEQPFIDSGYLLPVEGESK